MTDDSNFNVKYHSDRLASILDNLEPVKQKLTEIPIQTPSYEELYALREAMSQLRALSWLLKADLEETSPKPKKSFLKKLISK